MTKRMLIDATHAEETRVVVLDGNRLEDFDVETSTKRQLKGNIYLAKVVRVEPSLQAAFVEYGGGRHGFLAFGEIHPDYYQIPVADRQRLLELQAEEAREEEEAEEAAERVREAEAGLEVDESQAPAQDWPPVQDVDSVEPAGLSAEIAAGAELEPQSVAPFPPSETVASTQPDAPPEPGTPAAEAAPILQSGGTEQAHDDRLAGALGHVPAAHASIFDSPSAMTPPPADAPPGAADEQTEPEPPRPAQAAAIPQDVRFGEVSEIEAPLHGAGASRDEDAVLEPEGEDEPAAEETVAADVETLDAEIEPPDLDSPPADLPPPETIGGETDTYDGAAEARARRASRLLRNYRIQEVIRRRQIMLVQVVKEERGTKGAALTTYISLAGRFCVLMPNSPRGGGISRKITSLADRRRLKEITAELDIPKGMGLIVRTAGANRPKAEIKRDCEYLMRLWDDIRELTLHSVAPALIYEEASLIKRAIRDVYSRDIEDVLVDGEQGWRAAHDFMRMLMPTHARKVQLWRPEANGTAQSLFSRFGVEVQLDAMLSPTVQLRSGGYLVIAQTEALVSIDVNSGRSTRERGIEETALKTNLEAADEVARQLRLRDLAGLIVIDFIDMESKKHNAMVERRLKDALKNDRARIQVGHVSHFGLLEMSRQRLRPSLAETSLVICPHCGGAGHVRSVESSAIHILRAIEEEGGKRRANLIMVHCAGSIVMYLLNHKRERLAEIEQRYAMRVHFTADDSLIAGNLRIDRLQPALREPERPVSTAVIPAPPAYDVVEDEDIEDEEEDEIEARANGTAEQSSSSEEEGERRRRRRRRRGSRREQPRDEARGEQGVAAPLEEEDRGDTGEVEGAEEAVEPGEPVGIEADAAQPTIDPADLDENGLPRPRGPRRSRRGGRRRGRREEGGAPYEAGEEELAPVGPVYSGPTPADPFARHEFDIFDLMDRVEQERRPPLDIPPIPPGATQPTPQEPLVETATPEPERGVEPEPATPEPVAEAPPAPEPIAAEALSLPPPEGPPVAAAEPAPAEPVVGPAIQPIVIGSEETPTAERKRGWWRR